MRRDLDSLHNSRMSAYEKAECLESIRAQIQSSWRTDEIRRSKPSPQVPTGCPRPVIDSSAALKLRCRTVNGFASLRGPWEGCDMLALRLRSRHCN